MSLPKMFVWFVAVLCLVAASTLQASPPLSLEQQARLGKAKRFERSGWTYLHIEGGPRERGFQHGFLLAKEIAEGMRATRVSWEYQSAIDWKWLVGQSAAMFLPKIDSEILVELDGITEGLRIAGVEVTREDLIAYNGITELSGYWWPIELKKMKDAPTPTVRQSCSAFIATGSWTKDGNVVLGHNTMQSYADVLPKVIVDVVPTKGHRILMQAYPGWIHSGTDFFITDAGIVGAETTIGGFEGFDTNGVPEFVRMRRATQDADSMEAWCEAMKRGNNGGYANAWLLGDIRTKEIARLELGLKYTGFEKKHDGYFSGSNVAEDLKILRFETGANELDIRTSSVARRVRWKQLMTQHRGKVDVALAKSFESDHYDTYLNKSRPGGRSLCGHFELDPEPAGPWPGVPFGCTGSLDAKVVDATMAKQMRVAARWGAACGRPFDAHTFLAAHPQFDWMKEILTDRPGQLWAEFRAGE